MKTHTKLRPYKCDLCPKQFCHSSTLRKPKKQHLNEKPYTCELCNWGFFEKCELSRHRSTKHVNWTIYFSILFVYNKGANIFFTFLLSTSSYYPDIEEEQNPKVLSSFCWLNYIIVSKYSVAK